MEQRFAIRDLDPKTLAYLLNVVRHQGRGLPGVYLETPRSILWKMVFPILGVLLGLLLAFLTFQVSWKSTADPFAVALWTSLSYLLAGGLVFYSFSRLRVSSYSDFLGYFTYVDPLYLYRGFGRRLSLIPLDLFLSASASHHYKDGRYYLSSTLQIDLADKRQYIELYSREKTEKMEDFLNTLLQRGEESPAEKGYAALAQMDRREDDDEETPAATAVTDIPEPQVGSSSIRLALLSVGLIAGVVFLGCWSLATYLHDDALYESVKGRGAGPLRMYLRDSRNTRHREEVSAQLQEIHEQAVRNLERQENTALVKGLAGAVRRLGSEVQPDLTICFLSHPKKPESPEGYLSDAVLQTMQRNIVTEISVPLARYLGSDLVSPKLVKQSPAMIEISAQVKAPTKGEKKECLITWTLVLKPEPDFLEGKSSTVTLQTRIEDAKSDPAGLVRGAYLRLTQAFLDQLK